MLFWGRVLSFGALAHFLPFTGFDFWALCACRRAAWDHYHGYHYLSGSEHGAGTLTDQPNGYDMDPWTFGTVAAPQAVTDFFDDCLEGFWTLFWDCDLCAFAGRHPTYTSYELHGPGLRHP